MKISDKPSSATTRVIVMGLSGTGKSTLVAQLANNYKLWWFSLDNDVDILRKLSPEAQDNIELFDIPDSAAFPVAADTLMKVFKARKGNICNEHGVIDCAICKKAGAGFSVIDFSQLLPNRDIVVIDTGSQLSHSILAHATKGKPVDYKPERDDWGALRKWTEFFASEFQAAKFNLIVIFHAIEAEMEDGRTKLVPSFGSKDMSSKIAKSFSHVVYTDVVNKKHKAFSASTFANNILTKSRTDFRIEDMAEPSLLPIFQGLVKETKHEPEPTPQSPSPSTTSVDALAKMRAQMLLKAGHK